MPKALFLLLVRRQKGWQNGDYDESKKEFTSPNDTAYTLSAFYRMLCPLPAKQHPFRKGDAFL
jgi:hypothetical protein